jgi:uncharacterized cupredoxin-like copper-binding protein
MKSLQIICTCLVLISCNNINKNDEQIGQSEEIEQTPSLSQANKPIPDTVHLEALDYVFIPPDIILNQGREIVLIIKNNGEHDHGFHIDLPEAELEIQNPISPGKLDSLKIKVPDQPGEYIFYCPQENHREQAMEGRLVVKQSNP